MLGSGEVVRLQRAQRNSDCTNLPNALRLVAVHACFMSGSLLLLREKKGRPSCNAFAHCRKRKTSPPVVGGPRGRDGRGGGL